MSNFYIITKKRQHSDLPLCHEGSPF